ncbi:hypothetical protein HYC85_024800 [Camellia sinensis]|uniref:Uncharacterized protein n=1 Tax=Camellia sinensis TaxID=4442 RepID=A0A7J7GD21_CAMSI|nr:hypothetical protein HYC85_024800 [Camellia sinensis]
MKSQVASSLKVAETHSVTLTLSVNALPQRFEGRERYIDLMREGGIGDRDDDSNGDGDERGRW